MLHIGILAHSADGSALCYLECVRESARLLGDHVHPEITMSILPMGPTIPWWEAGDLPKINTHLRATAQRLADTDCDFFVCPDNTAHITRRSDRALPAAGASHLRRRRAPRQSRRAAAHCAARH
jgi:aspartate racemase